MTEVRSGSRGASNAALSVRVAALAEDSERVWKELGSIRDRMATADDITILSGELRTLSKQVSDAVKPQWTTLIGFSGIVLTLVGGFWFAGIQPIKETITIQNADIKSVASVQKEDTKELRDKMSQDQRNVYNELLRRNELFPTQSEYKEFKLRYESDQQHRKSAVQHIELMFQRTIDDLNKRIDGLMRVK